MSSREADPLSARAVVTGVVVGFIVSAMNVSFGLKAGWAQGGSVLSAAISIGVFAALKPERPFTPLEANIAQTVASAAGSMTMAAGLIGPIPALHMLGHRYDVPTIMLWGASVAYLGVFFAVPLRTHFLVHAKLRFPSGTATAETIRSMFADAGKAKDQVATLLRASVISAACALLTWLFPRLLNPPIFPALGLRRLAAHGWGLRVDATLVGGGLLMGFRVGCSLVFGAVIAWGFIAPEATARGWVTGDPLSMRGGARGLLLWPGVAAMATDSFAQLVLANGNGGAKSGARVSSPPSKGLLFLGGGGTHEDEMGDAEEYEGGGGGGMHDGAAGLETGERVGETAFFGENGSASGGEGSGGNAAPAGPPPLIGRDFRSSGGRRFGRRSHRGSPISLDRDAPHALGSDRIPRAWWVLGLGGASVSCAATLRVAFGMAAWRPLVAVPVAAAMSYIAVRCTGETDINPIGPMGKIIQLVFAFIAPGDAVTNLMAAAVACGGAGQAGDLMHDFKAGAMMRLSPRKQLLAQAIGVPVGILGAVPAYALFRDAYPLGGEQFPAPAAVAWRAVAEVLTGSGGGAGGAGGSSVGLPYPARRMMLFAAIATVLARLVERYGREGARRGWGWTRWMPSPTSAGIAFIVPPPFSVAVAVGAFASGAWAAKRPRQHREHAHVFASGLLAGAGVMGVVTACFDMSTSS